MTQDEIMELARKSGLIEPEQILLSFDATVFQLEAFAKLVAEKAIQPYLPYKAKIESMERAYDLHFAKAMGKK